MENILTVGWKFRGMFVALSCYACLLFHAISCMLHFLSILGFLSGRSAHPVRSVDQREIIGAKVTALQCEELLHALKHRRRLHETITENR